MKFSSTSVRYMVASIAKHYDKLPVEQFSWRIEWKLEKNLYPNLQCLFICNDKWSDREKLRKHNWH